jgi:hypothetical protein
MLPSGPIASDAPQLFAKRALGASPAGLCQPGTKTDLVLSRVAMTGENARSLVPEQTEAEGLRAFLRSNAKM